MNKYDVLKEFKDANAILKGHFILSSGLHSDTYLQCARALMDTKRSERLCSALADKVRENISEKIDLVIAPAMGGVVVGYEMGRKLGVETIFVERQDGKFTLRRGFEIKKGQNILVVEDVVTTGKSSLEAIKSIKEYGGNIVGEACLINRSGINNPVEGVKLIALTDIEVKTFGAENIPSELKSTKAIKPGSRWLNK